MFKKTLIFLLFVPVLIFAQYERPGSATAKFLGIGVSPRSAAMGEAYIAIANGAEATYYNPAKLPMIGGTIFSASHNEWLADINHDFLAIAHNFGALGSIGLSVTGLTSPEMKVRTPLQPEGTGKTFMVGHYRIGLTYARNLTDKVTFGGSINYIDLSLHEDFNEKAFSVDIAAMYSINYYGFAFGMMISNFGSSVKYVDEEYPLPLRFTFGLGFNPIETEMQKVIVSMAVMKPNDGQTLVSTGLEWGFYEHFFLRGGYHINHDVTRFSIGTGFRLKISNMQFNFDYAFSEYQEIGDAHRFGIGMAL